MHIGVRLSSGFSVSMRFLVLSLSLLVLRSAAAKPGPLFLLEISSCGNGACGLWETEAAEMLQDRSGRVVLALQVGFANAIFYENVYYILAGAYMHGTRDIGCVA